ncbi:fimbria/pilus periplasmic chaperone [Proteus myxofaciens]|uniref:FimC family chaperone n=1 Tax=Proteus myxofaciens ATCC 19692 TaxID=1354337 RepID=A0A198GMB5_9GAMM|nr:fimbria/pilus periplasmic chaperone [Proteus myxofaciens]OAT37979.1 FimC family chaperone [Proteus myxofaciens ATCC 19692]
MYLLYRHFITGIFLLLFSSLTYAGGMALGSTRIIYPLDAKQTSINITNTDKKVRFLVQSWVDNENDVKVNDFIVTPPLFVSKPESENTLRLIYAGQPLPTDRESLFWLNSKSIPEIERDEIQNKNILQLAILSRIKIFMRPQGLTFKLEDVPDSIEFKSVENNLSIKNPSPYYVTLINIKSGKEDIKSMMLSPLSTINIKTNSNINTNISYQTINDYGATTPIISKQIGK